MALKKVNRYVLKVKRQKKSQPRFFKFLEALKLQLILAPI